MGIIAAAFFPHPPIVLPEVGRGQERGAQATIEGMARLAGLVADLKPQVIAVVTPHGPAFSDVIALTDAPGLSGTMDQFGAPDVRIEKRIHRGLVRALEVEARRADLPVAALDDATLTRLKVRPMLDHGALVPLYFIEQRYRDYEILHISPGGLPLRKQFTAGQALARAATAAGLRVLVLASGDMSHRLSPTGPYGYDEAGPKFDGAIVNAIKEGQPGRILSIDPGLARKAGECGWRPVAFALGALDGHRINSQFISYEGPFGVGYMTALLSPDAEGAESALTNLSEAERSRASAVRQGEDGFVRLARAAVEKYVSSGTIPDWADMKAATGELDALRMERRKAGAFVSLHLDGELRGCMGTILPVCAHVGEEIIRNAVTACSEDPRFPAVQPEELDGLAIKVDVLSPFEPVSSPADLNPNRYGVIVEKGGRRGLLLPALEGVDTVENQLDIACRKAGFRWDGNDNAIKLYRFTVERHGAEE